MQLKKLEIGDELYCLDGWIGWTSHTIISISPKQAKDKNGYAWKREPEYFDKTYNSFKYKSIGRDSYAHLETPELKDKKENQDLRVALLRQLLGAKWSIYKTDVLKQIVEILDNNKQK